MRWWRDASAFRQHCSRLRRRTARLSNINIFRTVRLSVTTDCSLHIHFYTHSPVAGGLHMTRHDLTRHITHAVIYLSQHVLHSTRSAVSRVPAAAPMCHLRVPDRTLSISRHVRLMTLRGRTMHRDRIPTAQWQCPEIPPPHRIPTCPCSTSVNSTPLQRSKAQPPQFPFRENL